jgi:hypothetical protein
MAMGRLAQVATCRNGVTTSTQVSARKSARRPAAYSGHVVVTWVPVEPVEVGTDLTGVYIVTAVAHLKRKPGYWKK